MFYYPNVLTRHTGCFSIIWLAATKAIKVTRREYLKVNVKRTCDDIMDYVLVRVLPPMPGLPRPRFSLYLSSQLQYGVVIVYHRQCDILLKEIQVFVDQLAKQTSKKHDLKVPDRHTLSNPDALAHMDEAEWAQDPFFGVMKFGEAMPSPSTMILRDLEAFRDASPELVIDTETQDKQFTASLEIITLKEKEPLTLPVIEFEGAELPEFDGGMLDLLIEQVEHFPEGEAGADILEEGMERDGGAERRKRREMIRERESEGEIEVERDAVEQLAEREGGTVRDEERERETKELTASTLELQPTTLSTEDTIDQDLPDLPLEQPQPPKEEATPVSVHMLSSLPAEEEHARQRRTQRTPPLEDVFVPDERKRKRRKRQLIFFDKETQIATEVLQSYINNPLTETRRPNFFPLPSKRRISADELLSKPVTSLPEPLLLLWRQAATITTFPRPDPMQDVKEVLREMSGSDMLLPDISGQDPLSLEVSVHKDLSEEISPSPGTPQSKGSTVSIAGSVRLQDIPEEAPGIEAEEAPGVEEEEAPGVEEEEAPGVEAEEAPGVEAEEAPGVEAEEAAGVEAEEAAGVEAEEDWDQASSRDEAGSISEPMLFFHSLLPPQADRRTVSSAFWRLLENHASGILCVQQDMPYSDIKITPGPNSEETKLTL